MAEDTQDPQFWVDGEGISYDDFSFRERKTIARLIADLEGDPDDPRDEDFLPALITVFKRRTEPAFSVEAALDMKPADLMKPPRPTRQAASAKK